MHNPNHHSSTTVPNGRKADTLLLFISKDVNYSPSWQTSQAFVLFSERRSFFLYFFQNKANVFSLFPNLYLVTCFALRWFLSFLRASPTGIIVRCLKCFLLLKCFSVCEMIPYRLMGNYASTPLGSMRNSNCFCVWVLTHTRVLQTNK